MSKVEVPAVDTARAKSLAREIQRRFKLLGNDTCLNHAYEAVAAMAGFDTWSRMSARLQAPEQLSEESTGRMTRREIDKRLFEADLAKSTISFADIVPSRFNNEVVLSYSAKADYTSEHLGPLISSWISGAKRNAKVRIISFGDQLPGKKFPVPDGILGASGWIKGEDINIFDTPRGLREPGPAQRERLVAFLSALFNHSEDDEIAGLQGFAGALVDHIYNSFSDQSRVGRPTKYVPEADKAFHTALIAIYPSLHAAETWWSVSDILRERGQDLLADFAQSHASPRLDGLMRILRDEHILNVHSTGITSSGERLVDLAARTIASAIKEFDFLRKPSSVFLDCNNQSLAIKIAQRGHDGLANKLLYHIALDACLKNDFQEYQPGFGEVEGLFVLEGLDALGQTSATHSVIPLLDAAHTEGFEVILSTSSVSDVSQLISWVTTTLITSCENRRAVEKLRDAVQMSDVAVDLIHAHLFDLENRSGQTPAVAIRPGRRVTKEGLVLL